MHVADLDALFVQVFGQILGHALGQRGDQRAHSVGGHKTNFVQQIVDLRANRADFDFRVQKAGGTDHLFGEDAAGLLQLPCRRGGGDEDGLRTHGVPFLELQRSVVHAGRQAEPVFGQRHLAPEVTSIHAADLRHGDVALVGEDDGVVGDVFEQRGGRLARGAAGQIAGIVLDPVADARRLKHFEIEVGALFKPLRFKQLAIIHQLFQANV